MPITLNNEAAIVGIGQTDFTKNSGRSELQLAAECVKAAIADAGLDPADIDKIGRALSDAAADFAPATLAVGGIGFFPGLKRPRVIWVGLGGQTQLLIELQRKLEDNLAAIGFPKEKRPFKGHLTLGRIKVAVNANIIRQIMQEFSDLGGGEFTVARIILFKSDLKPSGPIYSQLQQATLE